MSESKIQIRAHILQEISKLRSIPAVSDKDIEAAISNLSQIEDKTFLCTTILKEIDGTIVYFDGILGILALHLAHCVLEKCVFVFLEKNDVSDEKKLFLINLLTQAGITVDSNLIHLYIKDPDTIIDLETERFLKMAEVNPEAQIDFLDFYYGVSKNDRDILLDSIINDYSGDLLANILTPLIYSLDDKEGLKMCMEGLLKSKSYLAYAPLSWLVQSSDDVHIASLAKKTKNELKIAGLRKEITTLEYYKELFKNSKPLTPFVSSIDGSSNFSFVFAREYENGSVLTFFTVLNLEYGPISCFGFSNISKKEYKNILSRFFKDTEKIPLTPEFAKSLTDELTSFGLKKNADIPYEFFCWRQLMYDIEPLETELFEYMKKNLCSMQELNSGDIKRALNSDYGVSWFFRASEEICPEFLGLTNKILALDEDEFEKIENLTKEFLESENVILLLNELKTRFLYQAYFLKCLDFKNLSSLFYSIYNEAKIKNTGENSFLMFAEFSIKRSIYEFFLNLEAVKNVSKQENIFLKKRKFENFDFNSKKMLKLIETKWITN